MNREKLYRTGGAVKDGKRLSDAILQSPTPLHKLRANPQKEQCKLSLHYFCAHNIRVAQTSGRKAATKVRKFAPKLFWSNLSAKQKSHAEDNLGMALMMFCRDTKRKSCEKAQFGRGGAEL